MRLPEDPEVRRAVESALGRLARAERFTGEISKHLGSTGHSEEVTAAAIRYLVENRLLDDERAAEDYVRRRSGKRAIGPRRLADELRSKGMDEGAAARAALEAVGESELETMKGLLATKRWGLADRGRAGRFLAARGFDESLIEAALAGLFESMAD